GGTVMLTGAAKPVSAPSNEQDLRSLTAEMSRGEVKTLLILGGNPVYNAPADADFAGGLKKVAVSIHLGMYPDETAVASNWHVPQAHYLESWGDATAPDGTASIQQPMIQPLHGGRTASELLAILTGYKDQKPYDIVRNHWPLDKSRWKKTLHDGVVD